MEAFLSKTLLHAHVHLKNLTSVCNPARYTCTHMKGFRHASYTAGSWFTQLLMALCRSHVFTPLLFFIFAVKGKVQGMFKSHDSYRSRWIREVCFQCTFSHFAASFLLNQYFDYMLDKKGIPKANLLHQPFRFLFFLLSSLINHLLTCQIYLVTPWWGPDPPGQDLLD